MKKINEFRLGKLSYTANGVKLIMQCTLAEARIFIGNNNGFWTDNTNKIYF